MIGSLFSFYIPMVIMVTTYSLTVHHLNKQKVAPSCENIFKQSAFIFSECILHEYPCPGWQCGRAGQAPRGHLRPGGGHCKYLLVQYLHIYNISTIYLHHIYSTTYLFTCVQVGATAYPGVGLGVPGMAQHIATTTQHQRYAS